VTKIFFLKNNSGLQFEYDINESYGIPMILNKKIGSKNFLRLTYSLREFDDTAKMNSAILPIKISITPL
jgi:LytS/YehU family sensor histidine kinase